MPEKIEIIAELKDLVSNHIKEINGEVNRLDNSIRNVGRGGSSGGGGFMGQVLGANLLTNAVMKAGSAVIDFGKDSIDAYAKQEVYEARLTTLLHDRKQAEIAIANIRKDAAKTPFDTSSLVQGNSMLIGAGASAKEARKVVMDLGNAIGATGGGSDELSRMVVNLGQIKSIGKASALDIKQFMYANIPIYEMLSQSMKKPISKIKDMDISYKDLTKALEYARTEHGMFYQGLENASQTLEGLRSNLSDTIDTLKTNIGTTFADTFKDAIRGLTSEIDNMNASMANSNKASKNMEKSKVNFSYLEKFTNTGDLIQIQEMQKKLTQMEDFAGKGDKELAAVKKNLLESKKQIFKNYNDEKDTASVLNEDAPDIKLVQRKFALIDDTLATIESIKKASKTEKEKSGSISKTPKELEHLAKANKPTQININIENLVRELTNNITSNEKAMVLTHEQVAKALVSAVNDISVLGQA